MSSIYGLYDRCGQLRYIGKANNPEARLKAHMRETMSGRRNYPVNLWIRKNGRPDLRILSADCANWREEERRLISDARANGANLLNIADGGDEPYCSTEKRSANGKKTGPVNIVKMHKYLEENPEKARAREVMVRLGHFVRSIVRNGGYTKEWLEDRRSMARYIYSKRPDLFPSIVKLFDSVPEPQDSFSSRAGARGGAR